MIKDEELIRTLKREEGQTDIVFSFLATSTSKKDPRVYRNIPGVRFESGEFRLNSDFPFPSDEYDPKIDYIKAYEEIYQEYDDPNDDIGDLKKNILEACTIYSQKKYAI